MLVDWGALEEVDEVAGNAVRESGRAGLQAGAVVGDLEGEGWDGVAGCDGWGRADGGGEDGGDEGVSELHPEDRKCGWFGLGR